jgi:hypothetical protein
MPDFGRWTGNGGDPSLNDISRDERFIDALASNEPVYATDPSEAELAFLLADWRDEIRDTPVTTVVTTRDAAIALRGALDSRKRTRTSLALVGSAAAALLVLGGFSAAVYGAGPGDTLYGVRSMLFGDQPAARNDQVVLASQQLAEVQQLVEQGDWQQAQDRLETLSTTVQSVDRVEDKQDLVQQWNALAFKVVEQDPAATLPPPDQPQPVLPSSPLTLLPVPVIEDTTTSSSTSTSTSTSPSDSSTSPSSSPSETPPTSPSESPPPSDLVIVTSTTPTSSSSPSSSPSTSTPTSTTTTTTTTTTTSRQPAALPPSSLPPSTVSVPSSAPAPPPVSAPPAVVAPPPVSVPPVSQPRIAATPTTVQAPPAVVAPSPPKQAEAPVESAPPSEAPAPPQEPEQVVTTTVAPPARNGN